MQEDQKLIEAVVKNISLEYELRKISSDDQLSKDELISKIIIAEATVQILKEKIRALEWENHIWNSSDGYRV
ncbi:MAG: hypothetical protein ABI760_21930 [Ferruginibacter sp.]